MKRALGCLVRITALFVLLGILLVGCAVACFETSYEEGYATQVFNTPAYVLLDSAKESANWPSSDIYNKNPTTFGGEHKVLGQEFKDGDRIQLITVRWRDTAWGFVKYIPNQLRTDQVFYIVWVYPQE